MLQQLRALLFTPIGRPAILLMMLLATCLAAYGATHLPPAPVTAQQLNRPGDAGIYERIVDHVARGENYYAAATAIQRAEDYSLKPAVTVRPPLLAVTLAQLPGRIWRTGLLWLLTATALIAFYESMRPENENGFILAALVMTGLGSVGDPAGLYFHEVWAAVFMTLSLAARRHVIASAALALVAILLRELALPFLIAMITVHAVQGRWRAVLIWFGALAIFGVALALHVHEVGKYTLPFDRVSEGWLGMNGWGMVLNAARMNTLFAHGGLVLAALVLPFALVGLLVWRSELGVICCLTVAMYVAAFLLCARTDNNYWGVLAAPFLLTGFPALIKALAPRDRLVLKGR